MNYMRKLLYVVCILYCQISLAEDFLPGSNFAEGWEVSWSRVHYTSSNLHKYINGAADLFLEFGFDSLTIRRYQKGEEELGLEVYKMKTPLAAYGVYLMKCGREVSSEDISARHTVNRFQFLILRDRYFIQVINYSGSKENLDAMTLLSNTLIKGIKPADDPEILNWLPQKGRTAGSERIVCGKYSLQSIYRFGPPGILGLENRNYGIAAEYKAADGSTFTRLRIKYPDEHKAAEILTGINQNLDLSLAKIKSSNDVLVFQDDKKKYGIIEKNGNFLDIRLHLKRY